MAEHPVLTPEGHPQSGIMALKWILGLPRMLGRFASEGDRTIQDYHGRLKLLKSLLSQGHPTLEKSLDPARSTHGPLISELSAMAQHLMNAIPVGDPSSPFKAAALRETRFKKLPSVVARLLREEPQVELLQQMRRASPTETVAHFSPGLGEHVELDRSVLAKLLNFSPPDQRPNVAVPSFAAGEADLGLTPGGKTTNRNIQIDPLIVALRRELASRIQSRRAEIRSAPPRSAPPQRRGIPSPEIPVLDILDRVDAEKAAFHHRAVSRHNTPELPLDPAPTPAETPRRERPNSDAEVAGATAYLGRFGNPQETLHTLRMLAAGSASLGVKGKMEEIHGLLNQVSKDAPLDEARLLGNPVAVHAREPLTRQERSALQASQDPYSTTRPDVDEEVQAARALPTSRDIETTRAALKNLFAEIPTWEEFTARKGALQGQLSKKPDPANPEAGRGHQDLSARLRNVDLMTPDLFHMMKRFVASKKGKFPVRLTSDQFQKMRELAWSTRQALNPEVQASVLQGSKGNLGIVLEGGRLITGTSPKGKITGRSHLFKNPRVEKKAEELNARKAAYRPDEPLSDRQLYNSKVTASRDFLSQGQNRRKANERVSSPLSSSPSAKRRQAEAGVADSPPPPTESDEWVTSPNYKGRALHGQSARANETLESMAVNVASDRSFERRERLEAHVDSLIKRVTDAEHQIWSKENPKLAADPARSEAEQQEIRRSVLERALHRVEVNKNTRVAMARDPRSDPETLAAVSNNYVGEDPSQNTIHGILRDMLVEAKNPPRSLSIAEREANERVVSLRKFREDAAAAHEAARVKASNEEETGYPMKVRRRPMGPKPTPEGAREIRREVKEARKTRKIEASNARTRHEVERHEESSLQEEKALARWERMGRPDVEADDPYYTAKKRILAAEAHREKTKRQRSVTAAGARRGKGSGLRTAITKGAATRSGPPTSGGARVKAKSLPVDDSSWTKRFESKGKGGAKEPNFEGLRALTSLRREVGVPRSKRKGGSK